MNIQCTVYCFGVKADTRAVKLSVSVWQARNKTNKTKQKKQKILQIIEFSSCSFPKKFLSYFV